MISRGSASDVSNDANRLSSNSTAAIRGFKTCHCSVQCSAGSAGVLAGPGRALLKQGHAFEGCFCAAAGPAKVCSA